MAEHPSFLARLRIAFACFFRALGDRGFAAFLGEVLGRRELPALGAGSGSPTPTPTPAPAPSLSPSPTPSPSPAPPPPPAPNLAAVATNGALQLLSLLQREGRLLDFCEDDVARYPDATVGAAARMVHTGCRKVLREHLELVPVRAEAEGTQVEVPPGFDPRAIRLTGNIVGDPPFRGALRHHGWRAASVRLPELSRELPGQGEGSPSEAARLLAPAEVELP